MIIPDNVNHSRYIVGIDLGTTHTVVAYADTSKKDFTVQLFPIQQLVAPGTVDEEQKLPSVRYHPADGEMANTDIRLPWTKPDIGDPVAQSIIGELARQLGSKTRGRYIASAKSWLCHGSVDRTADILPWGAADDVGKISPVLVSADFLAHIRSAWNAKFTGESLENQSVVITVPASFDDAARSLTLEAAKIAGLENVLLLEEPQSVFYDWLFRHQRDLNKQLKGVRLVLVCDLGGGTADFTLIKVEEGKVKPKLTRIGVGDHLMLGGDNIDFAVAHHIEKQLISGSKRLSTSDLFQLLEQCRIAKERLLANDAPDTVQITLLGSGSLLIGGARTIAISRNEVHEIVLDGFFPESPFDELPDRKRSGVVEFGLPYVVDPAVSKHIAAFLNFHAESCRNALGDQNTLPIPDVILLNGGVFLSPIVTKRVKELIASWGQKPVKVLENPRPDLAVAHGAVAYVLSQTTEKVQRIIGGSARSYFLTVESGIDKTPHGVCVLSKGTAENIPIQLMQQTFSLKLGRPVKFNLVSTTEDTEFKPGDLIEINLDRFVSLPPLATALKYSDVNGRKDVKVQLLAMLSSVGTLKLQCVSIADSEQRWDLEFQIRKKSHVETDVTAHLPTGFPQVVQHIQLAFGKKTKDINTKSIKGLRSDLEKILGTRTDWDTRLLRALFTELLDGVRNRRRSKDHERIWLSLAGFCLRPGFGDSVDDWRIEQIWPIYQQDLQFVGEVQNWSEWWTFWRRVAGGLNSQQQQKLFIDIGKFINPASARQGKNVTLIKKRGYTDMVRLAGVLERLPADNKVNLGEWLLKRLQTAGEPNESWWALGRIGARVPFHGGIETVVAKEIAADWLQRIMKSDWRKAANIAFAATLIARMSGDRERDIDGSIRQRVIHRLKKAKAPVSWIALVERVKELDEADEKRIFGEALPPGLKLLDE